MSDKRSGDAMQEATDQMTTGFENLAIAEVRLKNIEPTTADLATYIGSREDTYSLSRTIKKGGRIDRRFQAKDHDSYEPLAAALSWLSSRYGLLMISTRQMKEIVDLRNKDDSLTWKIADIMREQNDQVLNETAVIAKIVVETVVQERAPGYSVRLGLACFDHAESAYRVESNACGDGLTMGTIWLFLEDRNGPGGAFWSPIIPFDGGIEFEEHKFWDKMQEELDKGLVENN
ncbi:hypothetical protein MBLNU457_g0590t1 [Dothideomycetes sp. NU457]